MKSIMQEASSIIKALEKAWLSAGQPKEFSVKVFEQPEKNFLGMTTKSAKIGLFFQETEKKEIRSIPAKGEVIQPSKRVLHEPKKQPAKIIEKRTEVRPEPVAQMRERVIWSEEMISLATTWLTQVLKEMEKSSISFTTNVNNYYIRFTFDAPLADTPEKERQIFRSFSFLMLQTLKKTLKRPLRGFKVVLTR